MASQSCDQCQLCSVRSLSLVADGPTVNNVKPTFKSAAGADPSVSYAKDS